MVQSHSNDMIAIDGSTGGGQILRSSLTLSMVTGRPFRISRIRAMRSKPGLRRQHLTAVQAAQRVSSARIDGAELGSTELTFTPGPVQGGHFAFRINTAGSATLVMQTVLPALLLAPDPSHLELEGGTHNPLAPPYDFLAEVFLPWVNRMGPTVTMAFERHGFFPAGGGRFTAAIEPTPSLTGFDLLKRGEIVSTSAHAMVSRLPRDVAERELKVVARRLDWSPRDLHVVDVPNPLGPGNALLLKVTTDRLTEVFTAFGERGKPAEAVAKSAIAECEHYLAGSAPVGEYLADQLLLPLALSDGGSFRTTMLSEHTASHIELIRQFIDTPISVAEPEADGSVLIRVGDRVVV